MKKDIELPLKWKHFADVIMEDGSVIGRTEHAKVDGGAIWRTLIDGAAPNAQPPAYFLVSPGMVMVPADHPRFTEVVTSR